MCAPRRACRSPRSCERPPRRANGSALTPSEPGSRSTRRGLRPARSSTAKLCTTSAASHSRWPDCKGLSTRWAQGSKRAGRIAHALKYSTANTTHANSGIPAAPSLRRSPTTSSTSPHGDRPEHEPPTPDYLQAVCPQCRQIKIAERSEKAWVRDDVHGKTGLVPRTCATDAPPQPRTSRVMQATWSASSVPCSVEYRARTSGNAHTYDRAPRAARSARRGSPTLSVICSLVASAR